MRQLHRGAGKTLMTTDMLDLYVNVINCKNLDSETKTAIGLYSIDCIADLISKKSIPQQYEKPQAEEHPFFKTLLFVGDLADQPKRPTVVMKRHQKMHQLEHSKREANIFTN